MLNTKPCRLFLLGALTCALITAQMTVTGSISGNMTDPSGQALAGAKVSVLSTTTSEPRTAVANETGSFNLIAVQPGVYTLRVEHRDHLVIMPESERFVEVLRHRTEVPHRQ